ncbi:MAG: hypothetical protein AB8C95_15990 [Phycisphaeraceae bacterium]
MNSPPNQPGQANASKSTPLEQQLDALLSQIETVEPGTVEASALPSSFRPAKAEPESNASADIADAEIDALLNAPPAESAAIATEPAPTEPAADPSPAPATADPEQADMLAALNSALQGLSSDAPAEAAPEPEADAVAVTEASAPADEMSMEDKLQQEIASLMQAPPQADASAEVSEDFDGLEGSFESPESLAVATQTTPDSGPSTEDQIAMEIEGLLNPDLEDETVAASVATEVDPANPIDELDKMLAQEIDEDDELAGEFQSVEDLTAGIQIDHASHTTDDDEHAATAREVAAELDSQPEDLPAPPPAAAALAPGEDPFAALSEVADTAEQNEKEHDRRVAMKAPDWENLLKVGKERLLNLCFLLNWPARRFLTAEWRANLGYIALLNLFFGVGLWIVLIVF